MLIKSWDTWWTEPTVHADISDHSVIGIGKSCKKDVNDLYFVV